MTRVYWIIKGVENTNRPSDPWWYKNFNSKDKMNNFIENIKSCLHVFAIEKNAKNIDIMNIIPSDNAVFTYIKGE